jgi:serine/threonine protein kinase
VNPANEQSGLSLPGYTLSTRLGAGGYGEVWLAHAPGGLTKAVKFIFGSFHEKRAEHELRALQRVKEVRHPFLLSLERIEVVDGRLAIVTELADSSLKDRFDDCLRAHQPGVPRAELLKYLRDAADALDFLSEKHSLQHLDVKPENLLLVAGHVKVADFGLVKDIGNSQASLVGGLTPLYSAPEVFQGNPSRFSDQYSLAVLYQEMLTGVLPFAGQTAAELTLQHLHEEPNLSPLPVGDRYVLARALAKDPAQRFTSCSELIEALLAAPTAAEASWTTAPVAVPPERFAESPASSAARPGPMTEFFDERLEPRREKVTPSMLLDWTPAQPQPATSLPPVDVAAEGFRPQPTLVIGVGGTAAAVLKQLRARLVKEFGEGPLDAVQMLLLDSDPKTIARALQGDDRTALKPEETICLPLRRPQEYREQSSKLMRWLSRRWLYNIPRSLRTEGLRPLGRLAFADHSRQVIQRLRMALARAGDPESIRQSQEQTGRQFDDRAARVIVVASVSGGSGSGMALDVGYATRTALDKAGVDRSQVVGVFLHSTGSDPRRCDLAKVNAYAWLTEYNQFHRPGGQFPGDESCGLPPLPAGKRAFDSAYLVDLGPAPDDDAIDASAAAVAEYVFLDALTPAQTFFDHCRREDAHSAGGSAPLRTFALHKLSAAPDVSIDDAAATLSRQIVLRWAGGDEAEAGGVVAGALAPEAALRDTNQVVKGAATLVSQLQLKLEGLASNARVFIDAQIGGDQQTFFAELIGAARPEGRPLAPAEMLRIVDSLFSPPAAEVEGAYMLQRPLDAVVSPLAMKLAGDLARWVLRKLDDRQERLPGARLAAEWLVDHLQRLDDDASRLAAGLARQIAGAAEELRRDARPTTSAAEFQKALAYFRLRTDHHALWASSIIARRLLGELKSVAATVAELGRHLKHVARSLPGGEPSERAGDAFLRRLAERLGEVSDEVDQKIQQQFIDQNGGLFQTIMGNARVRAQLLVELNRLARSSAEKLAAEPEVCQAALAALEAPGSPATGQALPAFLQFGGSYRSLAIAPDASTAARMAAACGAAGRCEPSLLAGVGQDVILCYEAWDLPLPSVAVELIGRRRDYADFAHRVLTRGDVQWSPLTAPVVRPAAEPSAQAFDGATPAVTCVL